MPHFSAGRLYGALDIAKLYEEQGSRKLPTMAPVLIENSEAENANPVERRPNFHSP